MAAPEPAPSIPAFLRRTRTEFGDRPCIVLNDRRLTYADVEAESARLARGLIARGVGKGTRVGILFGNGPDWLVGWMAAARIGALTVPINTFFKPRELHWVLRHADVHTLLATATLLSNDYQARLEQTTPSLTAQRSGGEALLRCPELPQLRQVFVSGGAPRAWAVDLDELARAGERVDATLLRRVEDTVSPADALVVIYSSGSTADPKGAVHTHASILRQAHRLNAYRDFTCDERIWTPMPFFWVGGLVMGLLESMDIGCLVVCEEAFEAGETLALLERERVTSVMGWPQYAAALRDHPDFRTRDLSSVTSGSLYELLPEETRPTDRASRANSLGMTETCGPHTFDRMDVDLPEALRGSFGRALPGMEHRVIDPDTGEPLAPGASGEICVRGVGLMQGLYKREREDVFEPDGFYRTGDAGHFDADGHLFFEGRLGELIKTGGANVTPGEVEAAIDAQPEVQAAFVVGVPHETRGQDVAAAVVLGEGATLTVEGLTRRLREELAAYKLPRHVFFLEREVLPFTESGKLRRAALSEQLSRRIVRDD
jgi:acyl-CoA synthetase (AMP-forming)/AMP-acid ligase II